MSAQAAGTRRKHSNTVCAECAKPAAAPPPSSSSGGKNVAFRDCKDQYDVAEACMNTRNGQAKLCEKEWAAFRGCWEASRKTYYKTMRTLGEAAEEDAVRER